MERTKVEQEIENTKKRIILLETIKKNINTKINILQKKKNKPWPNKKNTSKLKELEMLETITRKLIINEIDKIKKLFKQKSQNKDCT